MPSISDFPILEMTMDKETLEISLADDKANLRAKLPRTMVQSIVDQWQAFQDGSMQKEKAYSRHYVGAWAKAKEV